MSAVVDVGSGPDVVWWQAERLFTLKGGREYVSALTYWVPEAPEEGTGSMRTRF
jgi:hypothetical protein